jgi:hypothetical protein
MASCSRAEGARRRRAVDESGGFEKDEQVGLVVVLCTMHYGFIAIGRNERLEVAIGGGGSPAVVSLACRPGPTRQ